MIRKQRQWDTALDDDPGAGLINLFDVWMAFAMALLLALIGYLYQARLLDPNAGPAATMDQVLEQLKDPKKMPRFRPTDAAMNGEGTRLGVAYQLKGGDVVYVPDGTAPGADAPGGAGSSGAP